MEHGGVNFTLQCRHGSPCVRPSFLSFPRYGICEIEFSHPHSLQDKLFRNKKAISEFFTLASNIGYLALPGQFFMGAKLFIGTPWMGNEGVLKILVWAM